MQPILTQLLKVKSEHIQMVKVLPFHHQIVFGAACCERLLPNYQAFEISHQWGDFIALQEAMNLIWQSLSDDSVHPQHLINLGQHLDTVIPDLEEFKSIYVEQAMYAATVVINVLQHCVSGEVEHLANVIEISTITIGTYLRDVALPYTRTFISKEKQQIYDAWVWGSPLIADELERQKKDIEDLQVHTVLTPEFLDKVRARAQLSSNNLIEREIVLVQ